MVVIVDVRLGMCGFLLAGIVTFVVACCRKRNCKVGLATQTRALGHAGLQCGASSA